MSSKKTDITKKFIEGINTVLNSGAEASLKDIAEKIDMNQATLYMVMGEKRTVPSKYYKNLTEIYQLEEPKEDYKDKYIALLEKQAEEKESLLQEVQALKISLTQIQKEVEWLASINQGYQEFWIERVAIQDKVPAADLHKAIARRAAEKLKRFQSEGIPLS